MIGDQIPTDILGARGSGLASCLALTGVTDSTQVESLTDPATDPDFILRDWSL